jgi:purine-nucleoside phosphorylase
MNEPITLQMIDAATSFVRQRIRLAPRVGIILGSGLSDLANAVEDAVAVPYSQIPHFPSSTVAGHAGRFVIGWLEGQPVVVMQGRIHFYEGHSMAQITLPVRVMQALGIEILIVTNAAGGLNPAFRPGDVMLICDHINLVGMTGFHPLWGPNLDALGPRFVDMMQAYDPALRALAREAAAEAGIVLREGVYVSLSGPSFETPAEIRFLRLIGGDSVGMSTAPEVTVARHGGTRVLGFSGISNVAVSDPEEARETTHEEVLETGRLLTPRLEALIRGVLRRL